MRDIACRSSGSSTPQRARSKRFDSTWRPARGSSSARGATPRARIPPFEAIELEVGRLFPPEVAT
jgi:hypothetical protein